MRSDFALKRSLDVFALPSLDFLKRNFPTRLPGRVQVRW